MQITRFVVVVGATLLLSGGPVAVSDAATTPGVVQIVQAFPGTRVGVAVDGGSVRRGVGVGTILGPYSLSAGSHDVTFTAPSGEVLMKTSVPVRSRSHTDVVLHRPASIAGDPVVNLYRTPRAPIGPGKARVLVAHTATVAPADVRVDGKTVFTNIANGEFAVADVPAGDHQVALLPSGETTNPILGPLDVSLAARTVTMVYAVGTPKNGSMDVIAHATRLGSDGTSAPAKIATGSAGLAAGDQVRPFAAPAGEDAGPGRPATVWAWSLLFLGLLAYGVRTGLGPERRRTRRSAGRRAGGSN